MDALGRFAVVDVADVVGVGVGVGVVVSAQRRAPAWRPLQS